LIYQFKSGANKIWVDGVISATSLVDFDPSGMTIKTVGEASDYTPGSRATDCGFFGEFVDSGLSEFELMNRASFPTLTNWAEFKRAKFDDQALTLSTITLLQNTEL
jgi:hypothetical protein